MENQKGLICEIYKWSLRDCSNGGISSTHTKVTLVGDNIPQIFPVSDAAPAVVIKSKIWDSEPYYYAEPVGLKGTMAGGAFIYSCDSRFPHRYPISLHDRVEA